MSQYNPALDRSVDETLPRFGVGSFGPVVFLVSEEHLALVKSVQRTTAARVEEHQVAGAKPRLEFLAPELDKVSFTVFWHCAFGVDPRVEIRKLRDLCLTGAVRHLILGGELFGRYILTEVSEKWKQSGPGGAPLTAEAGLTLKEYR